MNPGGFLLSLGEDQTDWVSASLSLPGVDLGRFPEVLVLEAREDPGIHFHCLVEISETITYVLAFAPSPPDVITI
jgi:hypothetical protein